MTTRTSDSIFRDVVRDKDVADKRRLTALESMARPSIRFLGEIAGDKANAAGLRLAAVERLEVAVQLRRAMKKLASKDKQNVRVESNEIDTGGEGQTTDGDGAGRSVADSSPDRGV